MKILLRQQPRQNHDFFASEAYKHSWLVLSLFMDFSFHSFTLTPLGRTLPAREEELDAEKSRNDRARNLMKVNEVLYFHLRSE